MLDFLNVSHRVKPRGGIEIFPKFRMMKSKDLMIKGGDFYAIWNEELGLWSTDEEDVVKLIDKEIDKYAIENADRVGPNPVKLYMWDASSGSYDDWLKYTKKQMWDSYRMLDETIIFSNTDVKKENYASKRLNYPLEPGSMPAYERIISTLYSKEERHKIEWAIGAIVTGASKYIQKFLVFYGAAGSGKSTIMNIIQQLFEGYYSVFDAKALGSANASFALEPFKNNPLVAIQHDGDLSRIEDNTRLNSLVSHEEMTVNEKFKSTYTNAFKCFLFMGSNKPVKITDGKSGLIRRLIDVTPSGNKLSPSEYKVAVEQVKFELGAIAYHCKEVYLDNPNAYDHYIPTNMMGASNDFYNFIIDVHQVFKNEDSVTLKAAWEMYKTYCDDAKVPYPYSKMYFKEELKNYFWEFEDGPNYEGRYSGFRNDILGRGETKNEETTSAYVIDFKNCNSRFDDICAENYAQLATSNDTPYKPWAEVKTKLREIDTSRVHYVKVPENHIVIDFDIKDENGEKSFERNLMEASKWPPTYAELSKSGGGIHLHYIYTGDPNKLSRVYDDHIEVKVFTGGSSLRRKLTKCNDLPIATISSGLPLKGEEKMVDFQSIQSEKGLRIMIQRNLDKKVHPSTKPSIDFIHKILEDAYDSGLNYDVSDMRNAVIAFAAGSTNQSDYCIKLVNKMKFKSEEASKPAESGNNELVFYDVEVFPNLFLVNWKFEGEGKPVVRMINPSSSEIEELMRFKLIGFNCRRYDNHILYARLMGYTNEQLYNLSQKIINSDRNAFFSEAYNVSYTDVYDFSVKKQSLKKWEIELGIHHQELGLPWDQPVAEELWETVAAYCDNDVIATEAVFHHLTGDWAARRMLAAITSMTENDTTNTLTTKFIFGNERNPRLEYTDLSIDFPGYEFVYSDEDKKYHNMYRGTDVGMGGYVYAEPGMYGNVALLDVASMHPNSIVNMNTFGDYTKRFKDILDARVAIKHGDLDAARKMFDGKLAPYLQNDEDAGNVAQALKIAINSVYGLTSASFDNPFRDIRNKNNIVALRGALFMRTLQDEIQARGFTVAHIKTDSIKIPDATPEIIEFVMEFGKQYGYTFEHEATYEKMCLVNDAVYIAKYKDGKHAGEWTATGAQFAVPYVFKKLFSKEDIVFEDMCETKSVSTALYLDFNENLPDVTEFEKELDKAESRYKKGELSDVMFEHICEDLKPKIEEGHQLRFIGKVGSFCPMKPGYGGGWLCREKEGKFYAATGSKGYRWYESEMVKELGYEEHIDRSYYDDLVNKAAETIMAYGDLEWFISDDPYVGPPFEKGEFMEKPVYDEELPWG